MFAKKILKMFWLFFGVAVVVVGLIILSTKSGPDSKKLRIGALIPLTGDISELGTRIRNGMDLAEAEIQKENGDIKIQLIYEDVCLPKDAVAAAKKLIEVDKVSIIIGASFCLIGLEPVIPMAQKHGILIFNTAANPDSVLNQKYVFSTNVSIKSDSERLAVFAMDTLGSKTAAIISLQTPFGESYRDNLTEYFTQQGGTVVLGESFEIFENDFRPLITKLRSRKPDVIFTINHGGSLGNFLKQVREGGIESTVIGDYESEDPTVIQAAGNAAEGFIISSSEPKTETKTGEQFKETYQKKYGEEPDVLARNAYDALKLQVKAYVDCNGGAECMSRILFGVRDYEGASGLITINPDGSASKPTIFKIVKNGEFVRYASE